MKNSTGNVSISMIGLSAAFVGIISFVTHLGGRFIVEEKSQTWVDTVLLSCSRVQAEGLERMGEAANKVSQFVVNPRPEKVEILYKDWVSLEVMLRDLGKSLSSYKGRMKAITKIISESQLVTRDFFNLPDQFDLGIQLQSQWVTDEKKNMRLMTNFWPQRSWKSSTKNPTNGNPLLFSMNLSWHHGGKEEISKMSSGTIYWDADSLNTVIQVSGNGGFPAQWGDCFYQGQYRPARYGYFDGELSGGVK